MKLEEEFQKEFDRVIKTMAVRYMADLIAIRVEETGEYFILKSLRLPRESFVSSEVFKEELCKCIRPIVITDMGMRVKRDAKRISNAIIGMIEDS